MTQFKDKSAKGGEGAASVGLFTYPILQAADILLYRPHYVPGRRGPAPAPRADPRPRAAVQPPLQEDLPAARALHPQGHRQDHRPAGPDARRCRSRRPRRRASSRCSTTPRSAPRRSARAVTDSGSEIRFDPEEKPGVSNLLTIYSALTGASIADLEEQYDGRGYGDLKKDLAEVVVEFVTPFRDRTLELLDDQAHLTDVLAAGRRAGAARSPRPPCATSTSGSASSPRASPARVERDADDRCRPRDPGALGDRSSRTTAPRSVTTTADADPDPHHAGPADRGRRRRRSPAIEEHLAEVAAEVARASACTCAAPAPSGRSRRSSS